MKAGFGNCNGTFGELVQGVIEDRPLLISFPIPIFNSKAMYINDLESPLSVSPPKEKVKRACEKFLDYYSLPSHGHLFLESNIPEGKGFSSSSADIIASIRAIADCLRLSISDKLLSEIATQIEPTDPVMYNDVVAYDYIHGQLIEKFGVLPDLWLLGIDTGGQVDTVSFNEAKKAYSENDKEAFRKAYHLVKKGSETKDVADIFAAATISATINQKFLQKPYFNELKNLAQKFHGGLIAAHSGTVIGILMERNHSNDIHQLIEEMEKIDLAPILIKLQSSISSSSC